VYKGIRKKPSQTAAFRCCRFRFPGSLVFLAHGIFYLRSARECWGFLLVLALDGATNNRGGSRFCYRQGAKQEKRPCPFLNLFQHREHFEHLDHEMLCGGSLPQSPYQVGWPEIELSEGFFPEPLDDIYADGIAADYAAAP